MVSLQSQEKVKAADSPLFDVTAIVGAGFTMRCATELYLFHMPSLGLKSIAANSNRLPPWTHIVGSQNRQRRELKKSRESNECKAK